MRQGKAELFIQIPRGMQAVKGPKVDLAVLAGLAKRHGRVEQRRGGPGTAPLVRGDEPAQMGTLLRRLAAVNGNGAFDLVILQQQPQAIGPVVIALAKLGQLARHPGLKRQAKPDSALL
jgi:hypothetical protein